jgi:hypothetical protein
VRPGVLVPLLQHVAGNDQILDEGVD